MIQRRDDVIFERDGKLFCHACDRLLTPNETEASHVHDFLKYDLAESIDLTSLKQDTTQVIRSSRRPERAGEEGDSDLLDWSIIDAVEVINRNPILATTGSCSGHDGFPFLCLVFRESKVRDHYLDIIRKAGFRTVLSDYYRMGFFSTNFGEVKIREEWGILPAEDRDYTAAESKQIWAEWLKLLAT